MILQLVKMSFAGVVVFLASCSSQTVSDPKDILGSSGNITVIAKLEIETKDLIHPDFKNKLKRYGVELTKFRVEQYVYSASDASRGYRYDFLNEDKLLNSLYAPEFLHGKSPLMQLDRELEENEIPDSSAFRSQLGLVKDGKVYKLCPSGQYNRCKINVVDGIVTEFSFTDDPPEGDTWSSNRKATIGEDISFGETLNQALEIRGYNSSGSQKIVKVTLSDGSEQIWMDLDGRVSNFKPSVVLDLVPDSSNANKSNLTYDGVEVGAVFNGKIEAFCTSAFSAACDIKLHRNYQGSISMELKK